MKIYKDCDLLVGNKPENDSDTQYYIKEAYDHIKPYLKEQEELHEMCSRCEAYNGTDHDYEECREKMCFKMFLAFVYLNWLNAFS